MQRVDSRATESSSNVAQWRQLQRHEVFAIHKGRGWQRGDLQAKRLFLKASFDVADEVVKLALSIGSVRARIVLSLHVFFELAAVVVLFRRESKVRIIGRLRILPIIDSLEILQILSSFLVPRFPSFFVLFEVRERWGPKHRDNVLKAAIQLPLPPPVRWQNLESYYLFRHATQAG